MRIEKNILHENVHLFVLCLFSVGVVCSKFLMSLAIIIGVINLISEAKFREYYQNLKKNTFFAAVFLFFILHIIGMLWSENIDYGLNDIRRKLSIIAVPIILISKPILWRRDYNKILFCFIGALVITSLINSTNFFFLKGGEGYTDPREELSLFNSHIRYAIMIAFGIPILLEFNSASKNRKLVLILIAFWFLFYTYFSQVLTGIISLLAIFFAYSIYQLIAKNKTRFVWILFVFIFSGIGSIYFVLSADYDKVDAAEIHFVSMKKEWIKKSRMPFDGLDQRKQELKYTLSRFLQSKNLSCDGQGVSDLSESEIKAVESGKANVSEMNIGFWGRIEGLRFQIHHSNDPNGHSLLQRIEAWKAGLEICKENLLIGVGTGDVDDSFKAKYKENDSKLKGKNQIRAHNTYLTVLLTFGPIGLLLFIYLIFAHVKIQFQSKQIMGFVFMCVMIVTFLFEDTLETQTGITLFSFFGALYSIPIPINKND